MFGQFLEPLCSAFLFSILQIIDAYYSRRKQNKTKKIIEKVIVIDANDNLRCEWSHNTNKQTFMHLNKLPLITYHFDLNEMLYVLHYYNGSSSKIITGKILLYEKFFQSYSCLKQQTNISKTHENTSHHYYHHYHKDDDDDEYSVK